MSTISLPGTAAANSVIRVGGSGTGSEVVKHLAAEFGKRNPGIRITIAPSLGSSGGIKALNAGSLDIALSARPLKDDEKGSGAVPVYTGRTPFVFMVNKGVPLSGVTTRDLEAIYSLRRQTWSDGSPVRLVLRPEGDSDTRLLQAISPELSQALNNLYARPGMQVAMTDQESGRSITRTSGALGVSSLAQHLSERLEGRMLSYNGIKPSMKALRNGSYPLSKPQIVYVIPSRLSPDAKNFVSFLSSPQAAHHWEAYGILPEATR